MKTTKLLHTALVTLFLTGLSLAQAKTNLAESTQKNAEAQIRHLIEPLLEMVKVQTTLTSETTSTSLNTQIKKDAGWYDRELP